MKFIIDKTSDFSKSKKRRKKPVEGAIQNEKLEWEININTIEELIDLIKRCDSHEIITSVYKDKPRIEIYDEYRE